MRNILEKLVKGELSVEEAEKRLRLHEIERLGEKLKIDIGREARTGMPEVILGKGKTTEDILEASLELVKTNGYALITKLTPEQWNEVNNRIPKGIIHKYFEEGEVLLLQEKGYEPPPLVGKVGILTAGTADIPIAKEAEAICKALGCLVVTEFDVGIASLSRTLEAAKEMTRAEVNILIVVAGMEGSLPSVLSSLLDIPIIGVPTDKGSDSGGKGIVPTLTMLNSCSPGLTIANVNSGFGAASFAVLLLRQMTKLYEEPHRTREYHPHASSNGRIDKQ